MSNYPFVIEKLSLDKDFKVEDKVVGYFVKSTAPLNVEENYLNRETNNLEDDQAERNPDIFIQEIANFLYEHHQLVRRFFHMSDVESTDKPKVKEFVEQMALLVSLQLQDEYKNGVVANFERIMAIADIVNEFNLPENVETGYVFEP